MDEIYEELSPKEVRERVRRAVEVMDEGVNELNGTPGLNDPQRHAFFERQCLLFLEKEYGIAVSGYQEG